MQTTASDFLIIELGHQTCGLNKKDPTTMGSYSRMLNHQGMKLFDRIKMFPGGMA